MIADFAHLFELNARGTLVHARIYVGRDEDDPLRTLVYKPIVYKGV